MAKILYINTVCANCTRHSEYETRLDCLDLAKKETFNIFRLLNIPMDEQNILVQTINQENTCWDNFKGILSKFIRNESD
jgi:hypothetical protein